MGMAVFIAWDCIVNQTADAIFEILVLNYI